MKRVLCMILAALVLVSCSASVGLAAPAELIKSASAGPPSSPPAPDGAVPRDNPPAAPLSPGAGQPESSGSETAEPETTPPEAASPDTASPGPAEPADAAGPEEPYVRTVDPAKPMVALTFDDGPHGTFTDDILDILDENHSVATFFEVAVNVAAHPEPVAREMELGCEVGSHSYAHRNLGKMKKSAMLNDLAAADKEFIAATGQAPTLLRPPYGSVSKALIHESGRAGITWSIDTLDWKSKDTQKIVDYVQGLGNLDGEVILLHSIYSTTVEAVRILIPWLIEQGYQLVTVTELFAYYYGELPQANHLYGYTYFARHGRTDTPLALPESGAPKEQQAG